MRATAPAIGTGLSQGVASGIPQQGQALGVPLYDAWGHYVRHVPLADIGGLEAAGRVTIVQSQGRILRVYLKSTPRAEHFQWARRPSAGATVMQGRRVEVKG